MVPPKLRILLFEVLDLVTDFLKYVLDEVFQLQQTILEVLRMSICPSHKILNILAHLPKFANDVLFLAVL